MTRAVTYTWYLVYIFFQFHPFRLSYSQVLLVVGLAALWLYLATHPYDPIARFLAGLFPREMSVLGLAADGGRLQARGFRG